MLPRQSRQRANTENNMAKPPTAESPDTLVKTSRDSNEPQRGLPFSRAKELLKEFSERSDIKEQV